MTMRIDSAHYIKETTELAEELRQRLEFVEQHKLYLIHLESGVELVEVLKKVWDFGITAFIKTTEQMEKNLPKDIPF